MATTEQERLEMHLGLRKVLGDDVANTVMAHLPPSGWGDVARRHDITMALDMINLRLDTLERRLDGLERRIGIVITVGLAIGLALLGLQVQIMLSLAG
ncbi:MAG: hypothetical protein RLZZ254_1131 [Actinomycetota bacterium]|jgi:hypothetical protein